MFQPMAGMRNISAFDTHLKCRKRPKEDQDVEERLVVRHHHVRATGYDVLAALDLHAPQRVEASCRATPRST
jgi:hypothetical protein